MAMKPSITTTSSQGNPSSAAVIVNHGNTAASNEFRDENSFAATNVSMTINTVPQNQSEQYQTVLSTSLSSLIIDHHLPIYALPSLFHDHIHILGSDSSSISQDCENVDPSFNIDHEHHFDTVFRSPANCHQKRTNKESSLPNYRLELLHGYLQQALDITKDLCLEE